MMQHKDLSTALLRAKIESGEITFAGNERLKIYGTFGCKSGKRMLRENRVFFKDEQEALGRGFRPCGHCMKAEYDLWRRKNYSRA